MIEPDRSQMTSTAHAHCMLDNKGYRYTLRIRNTFHEHNDYANVPQCYVYVYIAYLIDSIINYKFPHYVPVCCNTDKWYK